MDLRILFVDFLSYFTRSFFSLSINEIREAPTILVLFRFISGMRRYWEKKVWVWFRTGLRISWDRIRV